MKYLKWFSGSALSMFRGLSSPLIRSLLTKILPLTDIAKVFALMSAIEGICPLISPVMYNSLYAATISTFPASIYVLSIAVTAICIIFTGWVFKVLYRYILQKYRFILLQKTDAYNTAKQQKTTECICAFKPNIEPNSCAGCIQPALVFFWDRYDRDMQ